MAEEIIQGNAQPLIFKLKRGPTPIADLPSTTESTFILRRKGQAAIALTITETPAGPKITLDDPVTGSVTVSLDSDDTDLDPGEYDAVLQNTYSATRKEEFQVLLGALVIEQIITP